MTDSIEIKSWDWIAEIQKLCRKAGDFQLKHFRTQPPGSGDEKLEKEYVSQIDIETENILKQGLQDICPEAGFYGEEGGQSGNQQLQWIVDPLDGTTNYLSGLDQFSISIALVRDGITQLSVIYKPPSGEYFTAVRGQGARHNAKELSPHARLPLSRALIGTGFPYRSPDLVDNFFGCAKDVLQAARGIRRLGTASLDLAYIAAGYLQGFWESDLQPYDVAAALLLLSETGGRYSSVRKKPFEMFRDRVIIVGLPGVYEELCEIVDRHY